MEKEEPSCTKSDWRTEAKRVAKGIRRQVLRHTLIHNGGYLSQACSSAEALAVLYTKVMVLGPSRGALLPRPFAGTPGPNNKASFTGANYNGPQAAHYDRFIFSPVHYALVLYSTLIEVGRLHPDALQQYNKDDSTMELIGAEHSPGHEVTAGSLGQAISQAGGIALARKLRRDSGRVFVFMSDGEFQEGQVWEAFSAFTHYSLDNIVVYVDANGQCCDGRLESVMGIEPLAERLRSFGAEVHEVDGHDIEALAAPVTFARQGKPLVVLARTDPCRGIEPLRDRSPFLHFIRFKDRKEYQIYASLLKGG